MENIRIQQLRRRYELETATLRLESQAKTALAKRNEARYDLSVSKSRLMDYEGGVRSFFDSLSGKKEGRLEELRLEIRRKEAALNALERELAGAQQVLNGTRTELERLPSPEAFREELASDPAAGAELARLEARFCAEALVPLLEENYRALFEMRRLMRGERAGELLSLVEKQEIQTAPNRVGEQCRVLLERLKAALAGLGIPFELEIYYRAPAAYIASAAAEHTRRDRLNQALDQTADTKKRVAAVLEELQ